MNLAVLSTLFIALLMSWLLTAVFYRYAHKRNLLDVPNARSSHATATPRGGGLAIVLTSLAGLALLALADVLNQPVLLACLGAGGLVALIGFIDDHQHIAARWRLLVHFAAAGWALYWLGGAPPVHVFGETSIPDWVGNVLAGLGLVWLLNLYNFMDGIDGIAASEAIFIAGAGLVFASLASHSELQWVAIMFIGSTLGFLIWNWPPAKIFMGDVGSGFLGIMLGIYAFWAMHEAVISVWAWLILFGVFFVDATVTLLRRIFQGLNWYEAHRSHAYQHAARRWGHQRITIGVCIINIVWLLPNAYLSQTFSTWAPVLTVLALAPLVALVLWLGAGKEKVQVSVRTSK